MQTDKHNLIFHNNMAFADVKSTGIIMIVTFYLTISASVNSNSKFQDSGIEREALRFLLRLFTKEYYLTRKFSGGKRFTANFPSFNQRKLRKLQLLYMQMSQTSTFLAPNFSVRKIVSREHMQPASISI